MSRESSLSAFWSCITLLLLLIAFAITVYVGSVGEAVPPNGYAIGIYTPEAITGTLSEDELGIRITVLKTSEGIKLDFRGLSAGQQIVMSLGTHPKCELPAGQNLIPIKPQRTADLMEPYRPDEFVGWTVFEIPAQPVRSSLFCSVVDYIYAPSFRQRSLSFRNQDKVGKPKGFVATPFYIEMTYLDVMTDYHWIVNVFREQVDSRWYRLKPSDEVLFEWTSVRQVGRETYLLVIVGALIAVAATTLIEALRFWLLLLAKRMLSEKNADSS